MDKPCVNSSSRLFTEGFRLYLNFEVVEAFDRPNGKMPSSYGNVVIFDCQHILPNLIESLMNQVKEYSEDPFFQNRVEGLLIDLKDLQIDNFAMQVDAVIRDRERYYLGLSDVSPILIIHSLLTENSYKKRIGLMIM